MRGTITPTNPNISHLPFAIQIYDNDSGLARSRQDALVKYFGDKLFIPSSQITTLEPAAYSARAVAAPGGPTHWMDAARQGIRLARQAVQEAGRTDHCAVAFSIHADVDRPQKRDTLQLLTRVFERQCLSGYEAEDRIAEAVLWGTGIVPYKRSRPAPAEVPLPMLRLNPTKGPR